MPRVTDAYRQSRRDQIAQAAIHCLARSGFAHTSMADIIAESGLSAGAIYSHFSGKGDIVRHVAGTLLRSRGEELRAAAVAAGRPLTPIEIVGFMLRAIDRQVVSKAVVVQLWAEATVDPELHGMVRDTLAQILAAYEKEVRPWLEQRRLEEGNGTQVTDEEVAAAASTMITLSQGWIARAALFGDDDPDAYLASAGRLLAR